MSQIQLRVIALIVFCFLILGVCFFLVRSGSDFRASKSVGSSSGAPGKEALEILTAAPENKSIQGANSNFSQELMLSADFYSFAMRAKNFPENGGRFYALWALSKCLEDSKVVAQRFLERNTSVLLQKATLSAQQQTAQQKLLTRCSNLSPSVATSASLAIVADDKGGSDRLRRSVRGLQTAYFGGDSEAFKRALQDLFDFHDPFVIGDWSERLGSMIGANSRSRRAERWFGGVNLVSVETDSVTAAQYDLAFRFAACGANTACEVDQEMLIECAYRGECVAGRDEYLLGQVLASGGKPKDVAKIRMLADRIRAAIDAGDVNAFVARR